jgi:CRP-like cAMP-binding protein
MVEDGTVVGQTGFAVRLSRALRVEAFRPSTLLVLGWEDFEDLVFRNPEVGVKTIRLLSERLAVCEGRLSDLIRKKVPARLAGLILALSEHQGVVTDDGSRRIPTRYTHRQLASMIGSNREAEESGRGGDKRPLHPRCGSGAPRARRPVDRTPWTLRPRTP